MGVPVVAIVGRPNVGKSSLFNWIANKRVAIVDPTAGVTRDRVSMLIRLGDRFFELTDTGGMGIEDTDDLTMEVEQQIETAIDLADVILFVVDARSGLAPLDEEVAKRLRYIDKPIICVANKCDDPAYEHEAAEFYKLGRGKLICVSAQNKRNLQGLLDLIEERLPKKEVDEGPQKEVALKLAIVGRRNVGKSTFINELAQSDRVIVSEVPGTTRDSIDVRFEHNDQAFVAIDTAGVRRKSSLANDIEFYSMARAERSIRRADVVFHFIDAQEGVSKVDKQLTEYVLQNHKPTIFVVNKWDLLKDTMPTERFANHIYGNFPSLDFVPIAFITAKDGKNVYRVLNLAQFLFKQSNKRANTSEINRILKIALEKQSPPTRQNRRPKIYYGTQVGVAPPTIVLFTNGPELFDNTYQRYLLKNFRDYLPFPEVPIKLHLRHRSKDEELPKDFIEDDKRQSKQESKKSSKKREPNLKDLKFTTDITEDDLKEKKSKFDSELWDDI